MVVYAHYESDTRVLQYTRALTERGDSVDVIALQAENTPSREVIDGVDVHRIQLRVRNERGRWTYLYRIVRFLVLATLLVARKHLSKRYDVIHVHSVPDFLVLAGAVPRLFGAKIILDIHDILPEFYASKFGSSPRSLLFKGLLCVERVSIALSDHVIIANHLWQSKLTNRAVNRDKCTAIINYPDPEIFCPRAHPAKKDAFVFLYPGTLNEHQGLDVAIRAFGRIADRVPGAEFHIYGEGPSKACLVALAAELGLSARVKFHDFVPVNEIAAVMASSDVAVVPKRASSNFGNEAASTKIMEFMAVGVPIVAARTKIDSFYHEDSRVKFFTSENENDLGNAMLSLFNDAGLRERLARNGLQYAERNNWQERKMDYLQLLDRLCSVAITTPDTAESAHIQ